MSGEEGWAAKNRHKNWYWWQNRREMTRAENKIKEK